MQHTYYHTCPDCSAHLDPGERCDCTKPGGYVITVLFADGDRITTRWSGTIVEATQHYPIGNQFNIGHGANDHYERIVGLEIKALTA